MRIMLVEDEATLREPLPATSRAKALPSGPRWEKKVLHGREGRSTWESSIWACPRCPAWK